MPPPPAIHADWADAPQTPGDWFYSGNQAVFGRSPTDHLFLMRCNRANRTVTLARVSAQQASQPMQIRTEFSDRLLYTQPRPGSGPGSGASLLATEVAATDSILDAMAISKGRFAVEVNGEAPLYIPSWPEVTRIIEDCR